ncbi:MAG: trypsin-like peptidase domain-containing protein [Oligoflexia bacterium]|nr:trypsin-like peptidase domain-containing protein [Oligoflexia bacterium]
MKLLKVSLCLLLSSLLISGVSFGKAYDVDQFTILRDINKVIYGVDDRVDYNSSTAAYKQLALSTAAQIPNDNLALNGNTYTIKGSNLMNLMDVCSSERFAKQLAAAQCSGFLVADDVLITAGHCISTVEDCNDHAWVFDYRVASASDGNLGGSVNIYVPSTSVYRCKEIIGHQEGSSVDYAVLRLDRSVTDRPALAYRRTGTIADNTKVLVIGHPSGLPTKISDGAIVRDSTPEGYFITNLDTYGGNSGSAVFNAQTREVEGILVRGDNDYVMAPSGNCFISNVCPDDGCRGEDVVKITSVKEINKL